MKGTICLGFKATAPNVTEEEFKKIVADWNSRSNVEAVSWREWKNNPFQMAGKKSYRISVTFKESARPVTEEDLDKLALNNNDNDNDNGGPQ